MYVCLLQLRVVRRVRCGVEIDVVDKDLSWPNILCSFSLSLAHPTADTLRCTQSSKHTLHHWMDIVVSAFSLYCLAPCKFCFLAPCCRAFHTFSDRDFLLLLFGLGLFRWWSEGRLLGWRFSWCNLLAYGTGWPIATPVNELIICACVLFLLFLYTILSDGVMMLELERKSPSSIPVHEIW